MSELPMSREEEIAWNKRLRSFKASLIKAKHRGDPHLVLSVCAEYREFCNATAWPDQWHTFNIAAADAQFSLGLAPVGVV